MESSHRMAARQLASQYQEYSARLYVKAQEYKDFDVSYYAIAMDLHYDYNQEAQKYLRLLLDIDDNDSIAF